MRKIIATPEIAIRVPINALHAGLSLKTMKDIGIMVNGVRDIKVDAIPIGNNENSS